MYKRIFIFFLLASLVSDLKAGTGHLLPKPHQITSGVGTFSLKQNIQLILPAI